MSKDVMALVSFIMSSGMFLGAILTIFKFWKFFRDKAMGDGRKLQQFEELQKDVNGMGKKVNENKSQTQNNTIEIEKLKVDLSGQLSKLETLITRDRSETIRDRSEMKEQIINIAKLLQLHVEHAK